VGNVSPCVARVWRIFSTAGCLALSATLQDEDLRNSQQNVSLRLRLIGCRIRDGSPSTRSWSVTQTETLHPNATLLILQIFIRIHLICCRWTLCCLVVVKQIFVPCYSATVMDVKELRPFWYRGCIEDRFWHRSWGFGFDLKHLELINMTGNR